MGKILNNTNQKNPTKSFGGKTRQLYVISSVKIPFQGVQATTTTSSALTSCPALFPRSFFKHCLHNLKQLIHMHHQLFVYILPNHPCSGSYGGKTAQVWNLWRYVQTFDCFEKAQPSCSLKNQGSLLTLWKPVYRQEILAQTSADSSSRSLVSTSSRGFCGQKIIMGPALSHKKQLYGKTKKNQPFVYMCAQSFQSTIWVNDTNVTNVLKVLLVRIFFNVMWNLFT